MIIMLEKETMFSHAHLGTIFLTLFASTDLNNLTRLIVFLLLELHDGKINENMFLIYDDKKTNDENT